jgi:hypothetical protein
MVCHIRQPVLREVIRKKLDVSHTWFTFTVTGSYAHLLFGVHVWRNRLITWLLRNWEETKIQTPSSHIR